MKDTRIAASAKHIVIAVTRRRTISGTGAEVNGKTGATGETGGPEPRGGTGGMGGGGGAEFGPPGAMVVLGGGSAGHGQVRVTFIPG